MMLFRVTCLFSKRKKIIHSLCYPFLQEPKW